MSSVDDLAKKYAKHIALPWRQNLAPPQRTIMVVYEPAEERRVRAHVAEFQTATELAGKSWQLVDVSDTFALWIDSHDYRDAYFDDPDSLSGAALTEFADFACSYATERASMREDRNAVIAILGAGSLFAFTTVRDFLQAFAPRVAGRLVVFFPGSFHNNNYRLLEARDGWDYLAFPITAGGNA